MESFKKVQTKDDTVTAATATETTSLLSDVQQVIYSRDDDMHNTTEESLETGQYKRSTTSSTMEDNGFFNRFKKMHFFLSLIILTVVYIICVLTKPLIDSPSFNYDDINTIISFGDSYTTRYLNMNDLTYACRNCTSAGGPNWVIYLSEATDWVSWDFAYNSAPVNNSIVGHQGSPVIDVSTQVRDLYHKVFVSPTDTISAIVASKYKGKKARTPKSTLTTIWVGINDIDITYNWKDVDQIDLEIMRQYQNLITELIEQGANQFMLINVPPIDRAPMWHNTISEKVIKSRVEGYNDKLEKMIKSLKHSHPSSIFFEYNAWSFFNKIMGSYKDYDLSDIDTFCPDWSHPIESKCKPIGEYFWLNDLHPTFRVHELMAKDVESYLSDQ